MPWLRRKRTLHERCMHLYEGVDVARVRYATVDLGHFPEWPFTGRGDIHIFRVLEGVGRTYIGYNPGTWIMDRHARVSQK